MVKHYILLSYYCFLLASLKTSQCLLCKFYWFFSMARMFFKNKLNSWATPPPFKLISTQLLFHVVRVQRGSISQQNAANWWENICIEMLVLNYLVLTGHSALSKVKNNKLHGTNNYLSFPPFAVLIALPLAFFFFRKDKFANYSGDGKAFFPLFNGVLNTVWAGGFGKR